MGKLKQLLETSEVWLASDERKAAKAKILLTEFHDMLNDAIIMGDTLFKETKEFTKIVREVLYKKTRPNPEN